MASSQDTEIILGPGKVLAIFLGLVVLSALFFALGYRMGSASVLTASTGEMPTTAATNGVRPSAARDGRGLPPSPKSESNSGNPNDGSASARSASPPEDVNSDAASLPPLGASYYVQVAAVSKQEDAEALVEALKRKQYPALTANTSPDKLFHVQVGPFSDVRDAENTRAKLMSDGYNPILKK